MPSFSRLRPGPKCSAKGTSGGGSACNEPTVPLGIVGCSVFLLDVLDRVLFLIMLLVRGVIGAALMPMASLVRLPCSGVVVWLCAVALVLNFTDDYSLCHALYGGEDDEAIRFMDTVLDEAQWLEDVERACRAIEELPVVKGTVGFIYSDKSANLNKVQATVWCCWDSAKRSFKQVVVACDEKDKPTHLEALRTLHAKLVAEHMGATHEHSGLRSLHHGPRVFASIGSLVHQGTGRASGMALAHGSSAQSAKISLMTARSDPPSKRLPATFGGQAKSLST